MTARFLLGLGDSIMAGGPILNGAPNVIELLQTRRRGERFSAHNAGIGGYTSANLKTLWETSYRGGSYTHLLILIGTNDLASGVASATIIANIDSIVTQALEDGLDVTLCTILPRKNGASYSAGLQTRLEEVNAWILAREDVTAVDTYVAMGDTDPMALKASYDTDGLHPNATGHVHWADTVDATVSW